MRLKNPLQKFAINCQRKVSVNIDLEKEELAADLKGSFLYFCQFFYRIVTGRDFIISQPIGRESHHITVARTLTQVQRLEIPCMHITVSYTHLDVYKRQKYYHGLNLKVSEAMFIRWIMSEVVDKVDANGMPIYPKDMTGFERSGPVASFAKMFKRIFAPKQPMENLERVTVKCHSTDRRQIVVDNHGPVDIECEILKMRNAIHGGLNA